MSYRLIDANELAIKYPEVNDMPCIYVDMPNGLDNKYHILSDEWTLVKDGLPKEEDRYLCTYKYGNAYGTVIRKFISGGWYTSVENYIRGIEEHDIVAWQPLPESYRPESEDKEMNDKETKQAYGYIVRNGCYENALNTSRSFIIFADDVIAADRWIEDYIKQQIDGEKHKDDDGNVVNWWWKYYSMEKIPVSEFDKDCINIVWLE